MLAPAQAIIVGAIVAILYPVVLAVMATFDPVMLTVVPVLKLVMIFMVAAAMLGGRRRCEGQNRKRTQSGENNLPHGATPLQEMEWCAGRILPGLNLPVMRGSPWLQAAPCDRLPLSAQAIRLIGGRIRKGGAYATVRNIPAALLFRLPDAVADEAAAALLKACGRGRGCAGPARNGRASASRRRPAGPPRSHRQSRDAGGGRTSGSGKSPPGRRG